jgi:hypothetical membrane protein
MRNKVFLYAGFIIPLVFWVTLLLCGSMTENYSHLRNLVSELGAIGTNTQYIFTAGLVLSSFLSLAFIVGLYKTAKENGLNTIPVLIILTFSFSIFGAAVFPLPLRLHGILGSPSMLMPLSPFLALILWKSKIIPGIKLASGTILIFMLLGFLTLVPEVLDSFFGLKQRIFHIAWSLWFIYLGVSFLKLNKISNSKL